MTNCICCPAPPCLLSSLQLGSSQGRVDKEDVAGGDADAPGHQEVVEGGVVAGHDQPLRVAEYFAENAKEDKTNLSMALHHFILLQNIRPASEHCWC